MTDAPPDDEPAAAPAPAQSTELAAAYAAGVGASGDNRYAHLMTSDQQKEFRDTFEFFDVDKGGDVDNRELGLMFRQLGLTPSDEEVERMIADFDYDHSGTIDFEEFCGMMLSSVRAARTPAWLTDRFADGVATADLTRAGAQKLLPLDLQLAVVDTLRRNTSCATLRLRGHGIGPFVASELAEVLTHVNATLRTVDLSRNLIADEGARAFAAALKRNRVLTALDLSANGISEAGGTEILKALRRGKHGVVSCALGDNLLPEWMLAAADAACLSVALPARLKKAAPTAQLELVEARLQPSHAALLHDHAASAKPPLRALALRAAPLLGAAGLVALGWGKSALPHEPSEPRPLSLLPCPPLMRLPRPAPLRASRLSHLELAACNIDGDGAAVLALLVRDGSLPRLSSPPSAAIASARRRPARRRLRRRRRRGCRSRSAPR